MNDDQYKRFRKMQSENIKCLFKKNDDHNWHFLVTGSSDNHYKVTITEAGIITCTCPDFKNHIKTRDCICKHCLCIVYNELKIFSDLDHKFFERCYFTPDEIYQIKNIFKNKNV